MVSCAVSGCKMRSKTSNLREHGISYHMFPKHPVLRGKWRKFCGQRESWIPSRSSVICSSHFTPESFDSLSNRRKLVRNAVPTLRGKVCCCKNDKNESGKSVSFEHLPKKSKSANEMRSIKKNVPPTQACRICLATNLKMFSLQHKQIKHYFEVMVGFEDDIPSLPQLVCYECSAQLMKSYNFIVKCKTSKEILENMINQYGLVKDSLIRNVNRDADLKSILTGHQITPTYIFAYEYDEEQNTSHLTSSEFVCDYDETVQPDADFEGILIVEESEPEDNGSMKSERSCGYADNDELTSDVEEIFIDEISDIDNRDGDPLEPEFDYIADHEINDDDNSEVGSETTADKHKIPIIKEKKRKRRETMLVDGLTPDEVNMKQYFDIVKIPTLKQQIEEWKKMIKNPTLENSPGSFKCKECSKVFKRAEAYHSHIQFHDPSRGSAQCPVCKIWYRDDAYMRSHTTRVHGRKFCCKSCPNVYSSVSTAKVHQRHHAGQSLECDRCSFVTKHMSTLNRHVRRDHVHALACDHCGYVAISELSLRRHRSRRHRGRPVPESNQEHRCKPCNLSFKTENALEVHLKTSMQHRNSAIADSPWMRNACRQCGLDFPDARALAAHLAEKHRRQLTFRINDTTSGSDRVTYPTACEHCGETMNTRREHWWHVRRRHPSEIKNYRRDISAICVTCGRGFQSVAQLKVHELRHGSPSLRCEECGRLFYDKWVLAHHRRRAHSAARPHVCPHCPKTFKDKSNRDRHVRLHTGETPYDCPLCSRKFSDSTRVKLHVRTSHCGLPYPPKKNKKRRENKVKVESD